MPIGGRALLFALVAASLLLSLEAPAAIVIRNMAQLDKERQVKLMLPSYAALVSATVAFNKCAQDYPLIPERKPYLDQKMATFSKDYVRAYMDAYTEKVKAPPGKNELNDIVIEIQRQQQVAATATSKSIEKGGCHFSGIDDLVQYVDALYKQDHAEAVVAPAMPAQGLPTSSETVPGSIAPNVAPGATTPAPATP